MKYTIYYSPQSKVITNVELDVLYNNIIKNFKNYWLSANSSTAEIHYFEDENLIASLIINVSIDNGIYLRYESNKEKISVFDKTKLSTIIWTKDVCDFSLGLFLPPQLAWDGIKKFLQTGNASNKINWMNPEDLPENGNY